MGIVIVPLAINVVKRYFLFLNEIKSHNELLTESMYIFVV